MMYKQHSMDHFSYNSCFITIDQTHGHCMDKLAIKVPIVVLILSLNIIILASYTATQCSSITPYYIHIEWLH